MQTRYNKDPFTDSEGVWKPFLHSTLKDLHEFWSSIHQAHLVTEDITIYTPDEIELTDEEWKPIIDAVQAARKRRDGGG